MVGGYTEKQIMPSYLITAILIIAGVYSFTDMGYADRYLIPILIFIIPVILSTFMKWNGRKKQSILLSLF